MATVLCLASALEKLAAVYTLGLQLTATTAIAANKNMHFITV
jgi:hypothetical protein